MSNQIIGRLSNFLCNEVFNRIPSHKLRLFTYRHFFHVNIGNQSSIGMHTYLNAANFIEIGNNCAIGQYVYLDGRGRLKIDSNVNITRGTSIYTATHDIRSPGWDYIENEVVIERDVWIGGNSVILPGVHIGKGAIIGAGSVVVKNVNSFDIVAGNPAKKIGVRPKKIEYLTEYFPLFY